MDHRAVAQAERINAAGHEVLRYVGGVISPEMETPKLLWLRERLPASFARAARFRDLADFSATAPPATTPARCAPPPAGGRTPGTTLSDAGSAPKTPGWDEGYFRQVGLGELAADGFARIGRSVRPMGERAGGLTEAAAADLGLAPGTRSGGLHQRRARGRARPPGRPARRARAHRGDAGGARRPHRRHPRPATWPWPRCSPSSSAACGALYWSAMVPGLWLTEGGQSATGAPHRSHHRLPRPRRRARRRGPAPRHHSAGPAQRPLSTRSRSARASRHWGRPPNPPARPASPPRSPAASTSCPITATATARRAPIPLDAGMVSGLKLSDSCSTSSRSSTWPPVQAIGAGHAPPSSRR